MTRQTVQALGVVLSCALSSLLSADTLDFTREVAPVLHKYCIGCHSGDGAEAGLVLDTQAGLMTGGESGSAINYQDLGESLFVARITGRAEPVMPPEDEPQPTEAERQILIRWVLDGAKLPASSANRSRVQFDQITPSQASKPVTALSFSVAGDQAVAHFGSVQLFDSRDHRVAAGARLTLKAPGKVHALRFNADGTRLIAATGVTGLRGEAVVCDVATGAVLHRLQGHDDAVYSVAISNNGELIATASYDRTIILWNAHTGAHIRTLKGHNGAVYDIAFSPDGKVLASASADATVKIWNTATGQRLDTLGQPLKEQYSVDISPDGAWVMAGGEDNRIRLWRLVSIERPQINPLLYSRFAHEGAIHQVRFTPDGQSVVSISSDQLAKLWTASELKLLNSYQVPDDSSLAMALTADGRHLALGRRDGDFAVIPLVARQSIHRGRAEQVARRSLDDRPTIHYAEREPNNEPIQAMTIELPSMIAGTIHSAAERADEDLFQFSATAGEAWIFEVKAAQADSALDSFIAVLDEQGRPIPRLHLQAVRDSYFTFRGKDSDTTGDFRLHNWEEMRLNQLLYCSGEVVKLYHYPRGPDSGFNVYPNFGSRQGYFDTTPMSHALHEPCYIVEPHPPGAILPPNGLPVFVLNYENDDDSQRRLGADSRLTFVAPRDGDFLLALRDVRGMEGPDFSYQLAIRPPEPSFRAKLIGKDPKVMPGSGRKFGIELERVDGFAGPVDIVVKHLPSGFSVLGPIQVEAGHDRAWATLVASEDAVTPSGPESDRVEIVASASVGDQPMTQVVGSLGRIEVEDTTKLTVRLVPDHEPLHGQASLPVVELTAGETTTATIRITRNGHDGRVGFGSEDAALNAPHGVYVDNIGLNGVLIVEGQSERQFFITAEPWVQPAERVIFVEAGEAGNPTSNPVLLRTLPR